MNGFVICGRTAAQMTCNRFAPVAVIASSGPASIPSIASEYSLPMTPMLWNARPNTPAALPGPKIASRTITTMSTSIDRRIVNITRTTA